MVRFTKLPILMKKASLGLTKKAAGKDIPNKVTIGIHHSRLINPHITIESDAILPMKCIKVAAIVLIAS